MGTPNQKDLGEGRGIAERSRLWWNQKPMRYDWQQISLAAEGIRNFRRGQVK
jgi:hypothetical protein